MATVPNRYYNSPWIADAAANLASALAPPDPEKTLANQRSKWEFERAQQVAKIQDEDRARREAAYPALGRLITGDYGNKVYEDPRIPEMLLRPPESRVVDTNAPTQEGDLQTVTRGGYSLSDAMSTLGTDSPKVKGQIALLERKLQNQNLLAEDRRALQLELAHLRGDYSMDRTNAIIAGQGDRQTAGFEHDDERQARQFDHDFDVINARAEATARAQGKKPYKLGHAEYKDIKLAVRRFEKENGMPLDNVERRELEARIAEEMAVTPQVPVASLNVFNRVFGKGKPATRTVDVPGKYFGTNTETQLAPNFDGADPQNLGGVVTQGLPEYLNRQPWMPAAGAAPGPAAAAPPAPSNMGAAATADTEAPPASMFKPGEALEFDDGSVWALINGVVTRIDNGG